jgi:hypothetical protein
MTAVIVVNVIVIDVNVAVIVVILIVIVVNVVNQSSPPLPWSREQWQHPVPSQ